MAITGNFPRTAPAPALLLCAAGLLAACSGGGVSSTDTAEYVTANQFMVGGSATGLSGSGLVLQNNGGDNLIVSASGAFTFATPLITGDSYNVSVLSQPLAPSQTCVVSNGSGTVGIANVTGIAVVCANKTSSSDQIGGSVTGLLGSGLVLQDDGGDNLAVNANGTFAFATSLPSGMHYGVSVLTPPINPYQDCAITNGTGTTAASDITNVVVSCKTNTNPAYMIGGTITGITGAGAVVLQDNARDNLTETTDGAFQFPTPIPSGSSYSVTASSIAGQQSETCTFTNATGVVGTSNVTNVAIACTPNIVISVKVSGLTGSGLVLQDNGGDNLSITQNGSASFPTALAGGSGFAVTVFSQPVLPTQTCVVGNGTGTATLGAVPNITVTCTTASFPIDVNLAGLAGGSVVFQDNGGNNLTLTANGTFPFTTPIVSGGAYAVTVLTQPTTPSQTCVVPNGTGTVSSATVIVNATCTTNSFTVGGTVTGLTAGTTGLVLQNNGGQNLPIGANGAFAFPAQLSGTAYDVTVLTPPAGWYCVVANATGVVTTAPVANVAVTCGIVGAYLYVTNSSDATLSGYGLDQNFGALLPLAGGAVTTGTLQPTSIVDGCIIGSAGSLYVANAGSNSISEYSLNLTSGALTSLGGPVTTLPSTSPEFLDFTLTTGCVVIALHGASNAASSYLAAAAGTLTSVSNPVSLGANTDPVASTNLTAAGLTYEYVVDEAAGNVSSLFLDTTTGALSAPSSTVATGVTPDAITIAPVYPAGTNTNPLSYFAYVANQGSNSLSEYNVNYDLGTLASLGAAATTGNAPSAVASANFYDGTTAIFTYYLYAANATDNTVSAYSINTTIPGTCGPTCIEPVGQLNQVNADAQTGALTIATGTDPVSMQVVSFGSAETYLIVVNELSNNISVYSISATSGALTPVPGSPFGSGVAPTSVAAWNLGS